MWLLIPKWHGSPAGHPGEQGLRVEVQWCQSTAAGVRPGVLTGGVVELWRGGSWDAWDSQVICVLAWGATGCSVSSPAHATDQ